MTTAAKPISNTASDKVELRAWLPDAPALIGLFVFAIVLWPTAVLNDTDTWWHLSAGDWIWQHRTVPHADPFSYTFAGKPWIAHEWLSEVLMSRAFAMAGWPGVMLLTAASAALGIWIVARQAARSLSGVALWLLVFGGMILFAPHLLARPHIIVLPFMAWWFAALVRAKSTPPWACLPLMVLWANMHGSFIAGLALIAPFAVEAALASDQRARAAMQWLAFLGAAAVAAAITPFGIDGLIFPLKLITMPGVDGIGEWSPVNLLRPQPLTVAVLGLVFAWWRQRPRVGIVRGLVLLNLFAASLHQQRHEMLLGVLGVLILAEPLGQTCTPHPDLIQRRHPWTAIALVMALAAARLCVPLTAPVTNRDPAAALAHVPSDVVDQRVFNAYAFGGQLIRAGIPVFIDSRADMYGPAFLNAYADAAGDPKTLAATLDRWHAGWTLLEPNSTAAIAMDHLPGWHRLYADGTAVIHVRNDLPAR